ncbi:Alpha/Beta hydrolase protein [Roridomyces roridus]|uniref:Alpha/Beta hydrolase protein n=1 Tax=Roridomyces roridus TaxID=1738132 RepID=A0AAD7BZ35_9AGAR|nr:Alpha/Beta hydrolase protein [Roridomyces roridus]
MSLRSLRPSKYVLSEEQKRMYASEKLMNFRWIAKVMATYSPYTLSPADFAPAEVQQYISSIGQFAEVAYSVMPVEFLFENLTTMLEPTFPLEGYESFRDAIFVAAFVGRVADVPGYITYRSQAKQLIVAFTGTASAMQAFYDIRALKHSHPSRRGKVHSGFWKLYKGIKAFALEGIRKGLAQHDVQELVITGHSMGGAVSQLLLLDILRDENLVPVGSLPIKLVVFGAPRSGTKGLVKYWGELVDKRREKCGEDSIIEYSVKTYNDGVPALPPRYFGYRHYVQTPFYFLHGNLYRIPPSESEYTSFHVSSDESKDPEKLVSLPIHPRGGHNYYNGRDMEKLLRRANWVDRAIKKGGDWKEGYRVRFEKYNNHK